MDQKIKRKWVKALRSGQYKQARRTLREPKGGAMCCLGVLCQIQGIDWRTSRFFTLVTTDPPRRFNAGLRQTQRELLGRMNDGYEDGKRHSFVQIADYIAANL